VKQSIFGLNENVAAALSYIFGPVSGLVALVLERENKFVRFHALQSTLWFLLLWVLNWGISFVVRVLHTLVRHIPVLGRLFGWLFFHLTNPLSMIFMVVLIISGLFLMYKAFKNETYKLPIIGDVVWTQVHK